MSTEIEMLKTLERIEDLLNSALASGKSSVTEKRRKVGKSEGADFSELNDSITRASKKVGKLEESADAFNDVLLSTTAVIKVFRDSMTSGYRATSSALTSLNEAIESSAKTMAEPKTGGTTAAGKAMGALADSITSTVIPAQQQQAKSSTEVAKAQTAQADAVTDSTKKQSKASSFLSGALSRFSVDIDDASDSAEWFSGQLRNLGYQLSEALINVTKDIYALQARGISAGDSLGTLYYNAMKAGMSLEEYTSMLGDNSAAVVRATSMSDFRASLKTTTDSLKQIGVFGPAANQLAASMRTNSVALGIPISQVDDVAKKQVETFKELRKTTMMTAEGFKELVETVSNNQNVQEDLLGLAPQERAARQQQLLEIGSLGHRLGLTQQASAQLTEALLAQRKATAQQRFQAAGYIRQAGAMVGMGAGETEELARLRMKKRRSPEEEARFAELSGQLEQRLQAMQNSGNIQAEFLAEKMSELLDSTPQGEVQKAAGKALLQTESGKPQNVDMGQTTSPLLQKVGEALTTLSGFMKNPLADAMVTFGSMLISMGVQAALLGKILGAVKALKGTDIDADKATPGKGAPKTKAPATKGAGVAGAATTVATTVDTGGVDADVKKTEKATVDGAKKKGKGFGKSLLSLPGKIVGSIFGLNVLDDLNFDANGDTIEKDPKVKGGIMAVAKKGAGALFRGILKATGIGLAVTALWGAVEEMFSGNIGAAFGEAESINWDTTKPGWMIEVVKGIFGKVDDMALAALRGVGKFLLEGIGFISHGLGFDIEEYLGRSLTNLLDEGLTQLTLMWKNTKIWLMEKFNFGGIFDDNIKEAKAEKTESEKTLQKLKSDKDATLTSIGEKNNEVINAQKDAAKKAAAETSKATAVLKDNVTFGIDSLAAAANRTVQGVQAAGKSTQTATAEPAKQTAVATPEPTKQASVTPPEVNKPQVAQSTSSEADKKRLTTAEVEQRLNEAGLQPGENETVLVLKQQLQILQQMLAYWTNQEDVAETLLKAGSRPSLPSNEKLYVAALGRRTA